jgi:hypothetical protein
MDARPILPLIQAPTLVLHRRDFEFIPIAHGRYLAEHIAGAMLIELAGIEQTLFWETPELALDHIERFLTGVRRVAQPTRVLATVLFTDIVGSAERAGELGDRRWRELLNVHDELAGRLVEEFGGRLVKTTGDGILATFDGPGRAVHAGQEADREQAQLGAGEEHDLRPLLAEPLGAFGSTVSGRPYSTAVPYISPRGSAISSRRTPSGSRK